MAKERIDTAKSAIELADNSLNFMEKIWQKINIGEPVTTTVTYLYPKSQMKTTRTYRLPINRRSWLKTKINLPVGRNFQILSVLDIESGIDYSNIIVEREESRVILDTTKLPDSSQYIMVTTANDIEKDYLNKIVDVRVSEVGSRENEDTEKHWIVAALKDEDALLRPFFKNATLEDVEVAVGINVDRHYSTILKKEDNPLIQLLRANQNIFTGIDLHRRSLEKTGKIQRKRLLKSMKKNKEDVCMDLAHLCLPHMFKNYVSTDNPNFVYIDSKRSENLMTIANMILPIPTQMRVTMYILL